MATETPITLEECTVMQRYAEMLYLEMMKHGAMKGDILVYIARKFEEFEAIRNGD